MTYFITIEELKQTTFNANLDDEYIAPALEEAQSIYLREIIGDLLYSSITSKIDEETLSGKYLTLVNQYIKPYLTYKVQSVIVIPLNNKTRNAGVIQQYDQGFNTSTMKDTAYLADYYNSRAEFYANRLTTYLQKNAADFPEYGYSDDNITQPTTSQNVTGIFLGGVGKKGCGCMGTGTSTTKTVDWNNITNKPDFADVATSGDYEDLTNKPEIPSLDGYATEQWVNDQGYSTFDGDYNSLTNKPTIPAAQVNSDWYAESGVSQILHKPDMNDYVLLANYNVQMQGVYNSLADKVTIGTFNSRLTEVDTELARKVNSAELCTINGERLDTRSDFELVRSDSIATVATTGNYNDLNNTPAIPTVNDATLTIKQGGVARGTFSANANQNVEINLDAGGAAQVQADWNEADSTAVDYIKNKPTIPTVPTNVSAFTNDAGYLTQHQDLTGYATETWVGQQGYSTFSGDYEDLTNKPTIPTVPTNVSAFTNDAGYTTFSGNYNDLTNKPTIPAAQVNTDWNANSGVAQILNKPSLATVATSGDYDDLTNKPTIPAAPVQSDWNQTDSTALDYIKNKPTVPSGQIQSDWNQTNTSSVDYIKNKPNLFSGDYNDLTNKPTIPAAQVNSDWNASTGVSQILNKPSLATVATSGDYDDLTNKPTIPAAQVQTDWNANSGMGQLLNKPSMTAETWTFTLSDNTTVTKTVWLQ